MAGKRVGLAEFQEITLVGLARVAAILELRISVRGEDYRSWLAGRNETGRSYDDGEGHDSA